MGLDITAYKNLKVVDFPQFEDYGDLKNWDTEWKPGASMEWSERHFPGRGEGVDANTVYSWEDKLSFRAGSYSGYNWWRARLEEFAEGNSFHELIEFADNEGVIGPVVSKKLLNDFIENEQRAIEHSKTIGENGNWWLSKYMDWRNAFMFAADNGAVEFC